MTMYETGILTIAEAVEFVKLFSLRVGTDYEVNADPASGIGRYVCCFELEGDEVDYCRDIENHVRRG